MIGSSQTVLLHDVSFLIFPKNQLQSRSLLEVQLAGMYVLGLENY